MRRMLVLVAALTILSSPGYAADIDIPEWEEGWRWCKFDHECRVVKDECGNWVAVNKGFMKQAQTYFFKARDLVVCDEPFLLPGPTAACNIKQRACEVTYAKRF